MGQPAEDLDGAPTATTKLTDEVTTQSVEEKASETPVTDEAEATIEVTTPEKAE